MRSDRGNFAQRATKKIVGIIIGVLIFMPLVIFLFGEIVLHLWNWLMPTLFHLSALRNFWQALGLMVLSWILFGGLRGLSGRGRRCRGHWRGRMRERWEEMTPEERERFREWVRTRSGPFATDAPNNA
jgi:Ca2+/H+ antiporter, TMEM165/GDT1 family